MLRALVTKMQWLSFDWKLEIRELTGLHNEKAVLV